ncbi:maleylpyruvate isomerase N-terminal domain-containing protein [Kitasatospora sp. CM 4170]|uniref:Maleylpyruvate isomerase N-terminal domain-containing protein n=1 Tax=Kitasatospora aburaviensis TaxID=67265 RepID=A0ABW1EVN7_9ACTN|nr:maleylpyruvate isomerase N-terminal domain-containing protein [Kitasatospora sp. CM 4170]WNM45105.1 maleylpyruvate isomerase N-terminal domain-containing protein [Kitasatospora sp. CM 4170]
MNADTREDTPRPDPSGTTTTDATAVAATTGGGPMGGDHVRAALDEVLRTLGPHTHDRDWSAPAGPLEWSCRETAVHIAHDLLAYAGQLAARPADRYLPLDLTVPPAAGPAEVLTVVTACARLLATALDAAPSDLRAWHFGPFDPPGFAAMGVSELLLHTHDIALGLGLPWRPPAGLSAAVLDRLTVDAPPGDPGDVLLWHTGRGELNGRPRRSSWTWRTAVTEG